MSNHVHLLIEQPDRESLPPLTKDELLRRVRFIYDEFTVRSLEQEFERAAKSSDPGREQRIIDRFTHRMGDVSKFMQELKQRFTQWYNRRNHRTGTLWEDRFKSVLVEADEEALMTMAAYIDLNPVRAGIVARPEDYRWSGYGAAMGGDRQARAGLGKILDESSRISGEDFESHWQETGKLYRWWLYQEGEEVEPAPESTAKGRKGFSHEKVEQVARHGRKVGLAKRLHCRIRYLTAGAVFGSAAFVDRIFESNRQHFGPRRQSGARRMRGGDWGKLRVLRDLQVDA